jgi:hypothetical protein
VRGATVATLLTLLSGALLTGCAGDSTAIASAPLCSDRSGAAGNGVILMAQSVPTATWVPCISAALPLGWNFHHLDARNGVSRFWLDSDRDGQQAVEVRLEQSCDVAGATQVPTDREGMTRLERVDRLSPAYAGERFYRFPGGCVTVVFALDGDNPSEALALSSQVVGAVARADLAAQVQKESGGRLTLDPPPSDGR